VLLAVEHRQAFWSDAFSLSEVIAQCSLGAKGLHAAHEHRRVHFTVTMGFSPVQGSSRGAHTLLLNGQGKLRANAGTDGCRRQRGGEPSPRIPQRRGMCFLKRNSMKKACRKLFYGKPCDVGATGLLTLSPLACGTRPFIRAVISVSALPMS